MTAIRIIIASPHERYRVEIKTFQESKKTEDKFKFEVEALLVNEMSYALRDVGFMSSIIEVNYQK
jgi:hypothetical protein